MKQNIPVRSAKRRAAPGRTERQKAAAFYKNFATITSWLEAVNEGPRVKGFVDIYAESAAAVALKSCGDHAIRLIVRLAQAGHPKAIREVVRLARELVETLEDVARLSPSDVRVLAAACPDWPVMISRHEVSDKAIALYLDEIELGRNCLINTADARQTKYSLRTPINRFVWRTLRKLRLSVELMSDVPEIAAIQLGELPPLTKATAKLWADKALVPYLCAMHDDFRSVAEFASILARPDVRTRGQQRREIRKDVIRSLVSLARPAGPETGQS